MPPSKIDYSFISLVDTDAAYSAQTHAAGVLVVVEAFSAEWGPCRALGEHFYYSVIDHEDQGRRVKVVRAVTEGVNALRKYRADSRSHFLFFVNGEQVAVVDGPVLPRIMTLIRQHAQPAQ